MKKGMKSRIDKLQIHKSNIFMITCMDFRFVLDVKKTMTELGYREDYDQYVIAGASLGFVSEDHANWGQAAVEHIQLGLALHHSRQIIFADH